jgi:hypothetical protein
VNVSRNGEIPGGSPVLPQTVDHGWRLYAVVLEGKGHIQEREYLRGSQKTAGEGYGLFWKEGSIARRSCCHSWR